MLIAVEAKLLEDFQCTCCNRFFTSRSNLLRHYSVYSGSHFVYPCCDEPFNWQSALNSHKCSSSSSSDAESIASNNKEDRDTSLEDFLENDVRSDEEKYEKKTFKCDNCPASYKHYRGIRTHLLKYPAKHDFICSKCRKHFLSENLLKKHLCFLADGKFVCCCKNVFTSLHRFKQHVGLHRPYTCCLCKRNAASINNLMNHIRTHTKERPFKCTVCSSSFRVRESLSLHKKLHTGMKPFHCAKCSYSSSTKWNLHLHEQRHNPNRDREKQFLCATCGYSCLFKHHLKRHLATHSEKNDHLCRICGRLFSQESYLNNHLKSHKKDSDFKHKCPKCNKELQRDELYHHHLETGHFRHSCNLCGKVFFKKFNLQRHQNAHEKQTKR